MKSLAAAIFISGAVASALAQQLDAAAPSPEPMPGFLDGNAGARLLRYRCAGAGTPTVLIEPGGDTSFETLVSWERTINFRPPWLNVIAEIEKSTRVCVYDRAGVGRSGKAPMPRTSDDVVTDVHALLRNEKIATPVVCVGHSFGGSNCRILASRYPEFVAGMVLVDTSDADARVVPDLSKSAEWIDLKANSKLLRRAQRIGDKPLIVLTASPTSTDPAIPPAEQAESNRIHQELQRKLSGLSTNSRQVIASTAGHNIQREEPQLVIDAVLDVVAQVRARGAHLPWSKIVNCGVIDALAHTFASRKRKRTAIACVRAAQRSGRSVIVSQGYSIQPDVAVENQVMLGADGEKILAHRAISGDEYENFVARCVVLDILDDGNVEIYGCEPDESLRTHFER